MGWTRPAIWARPAQGQTKLGGYNPPQVIFLIFFINIILLSKCIRLGRPRYSQIGPKKGWTDIGPTNLVWAGLDQLFGLGQHKANPNSGGGGYPQWLLSCRTNYCFAYKTKTRGTEEKKKRGVYLAWEAVGGLVVELVERDILSLLVPNLGHWFNPEGSQPLA